MATILDAQGRVYSSELLPQLTPDTQQPMQRGNGRGEAIIQPSTLNKAQLAREGSYFVTNSQNPVTGVPSSTKLLLGAAQVAFTDTIPIAYLYNPGPAIAYLDYLKLVGLLAHGSSTDALYLMIVKDSARALTTDNMTLYTPQAAMTLGNIAAKLQVKFQNSATNSAIAASTPATRQVVTIDAIPRWVGVLGDVVKITFGSWDVGDVNGPLTAASAAAPGRFGINVSAPVVIEPLRSATLHLWQPANIVAPSAYVELGHFER